MNVNTSSIFIYIWLVQIRGDEFGETLSVPYISDQVK